MKKSILIFSLIVLFLAGCTSQESLNNRLLEAVNKGNQEEVKTLLKKKADPNYADSNTLNTPLAVACMRGETQIAENLIKAGADVNSRNKQTFTPLHLASTYGHLDIVELLLAAQADVDAPVTAPQFNQFTPCMFAIKNKHFDIAERLLRAGADMNSPLGINFLSKTMPDTQVIKAWIEMGGQTAAQDSQGNTLLANALLADYQPVVDLLLQIN